MLLCDRQIRDLCVKRNGRECHEVMINHGLHWTDLPMIEPFSEAISGNGIISYGLAEAGFDMRVDPSEALIFKGSYGEIIDPKSFRKDVNDEYRNKMFDRLDISNLPDSRLILPAHSYVLIQSLEYFRFPRFLKGRCVGKSTLARAGIIVNTTPAEPGWHGKLTIEISNSAPCPACIYVGEGIAQMEFEVLSSEPEKDYSQKKGQYQHQTSVTPPKVL